MVSVGQGHPQDDLVGLHGNLTVPGRRRFCMRHAGRLRGVASRRRMAAGVRAGLNGVGWRLKR